MGTRIALTGGMTTSPILSEPPGRRRPASGRRRGFTLVEVMVSLAVLAIAGMGGIASFMTLNRYAANLRNLSEAHSLCQERIEQAQTMTFRPTASVLPMAVNADAATKATVLTLPILGAATNYNTTTGAFTGGSNYQTSTETIPIYTQSDGTSAKASANVVYTRTTTVSPTSLTYAANSTSLNIVLFTVTVSYVFHGQTYTTSMNTLRSPD